MDSFIHKHLANKAIVAIPPPPLRFTLNEWYRQNRFRDRICLDQQQLADRIIAESDRVRDEVEEKTELNKREVDHKLKEKIDEIEFNKLEIEKQRKQVCLEIDNLQTYMTRIKDALNGLQQNQAKICRECIILHEGRIGIDLCYDEIEVELKKEMEMIEGSQSLLTRVLEQANEQVRRLRATLYFIDRDLEDKENVLKIDRWNCDLKETSLNLSMYHGFTRLDISSITLEEWNQFTMENIERAAKEINCARQLRCYVDTLLNQVIEDLLNQFHACNSAFQRRIQEIKEEKTKLEIQHSEIHRQVNDMVMNITNLEKAINEKEGFMALAHTRLGNRAQRPGLELCRDLVECNLVNEVRELRNNLSCLQNMLSEAQASLRYLLKIQIQLEEDINVKTNTLKIDEVDCMTLRQTMDYHAY